VCVSEDTYTNHTFFFYFYSYVLTHEVKTLAAALSKLKLLTLLTPSATRVTT
jgi:hypothetical protein